MLGIRLRSLVVVFLALSVIGVFSPVSGLNPAAGAGIKGFVAPDAESYVSDTVWGSYGSANDEFINPEGVAVDSLGKAVFVADTGNHRIMKFNASGDFQFSFGAYGSAPGQFYGPRGIAIDKSGNVYVADTSNNRVQKFDKNGQFVCTLGGLTTPRGIALAGNTAYISNTGANAIVKMATSNCANTGGWGGAGSGDGQFNYPWGVAIDSQGKVYVGDHNNHRIQKFEPTGTFITKWGVYGSGDSRFGGVQFYGPLGVAIDGCDGVYVSDYYNNRIQKFTTSGAFVTSWGWTGSGRGQLNSPVGIAVDLAGKVYVAEYGNHRAQKFVPSTSDVTHLFKAKVGDPGSGDGQFSGPRSVAVDAAGEVYVADTGNNRIEVFSSTGTFLRKFGTFGSGNDNFYNPYGVTVDQGTSDVYVADSINNRIKKHNGSSGAYISQWGSAGTANGQFNFPRGIAYDESNNRVIVADQNNHRVQIFDNSGNFVRGIGNGTTWTGTAPTPAAGNTNSAFNTPTGVAVDGAGRIYVADYSNYRVQVFSSNGQFVTKWGSYGSGSGQFYGPVDVHVDANGVYVADQSNYRIQRFQTDGRFITRWSSYGSGDGLLYNPEGLATSPNGSLVYVVDVSNNRFQIFERFGFGLAITPPSQTIIRDAIANYTVTATGVGPNTLGTQVSFCLLSGQPNATTVSFTPAAVTPGISPKTSTLALDTSPTTKTKKYTLQILAIGGGQTRVVTATLTVNP